MDVERAGALEDLLRRAAILTQRGRPHLPLAPDALPAQARERRRRSDFDEGFEARVGERVHRGVELDGVAYLASPVVGLAKIRHGDLASGDARDHARRRRTEVERRRAPRELIGDRVHLRRVKRVRDRETLHFDALRGELGLDRGKLLEPSAQHRRLGGVCRGNADELLVPGDRGFARRARRPQRRHSPAAAEGLHQSTTFGDELQPIVERPHAGDAERDVFPDAMSDDRGGLHAPASPQLGEGPLHGDQRGLRVRGLVETRGLRAV